MFGRLNDSPPVPQQATRPRRGFRRRGIGVPGFIAPTVQPVVYRATVVQSPPPDVSAGGTLIQNVPLLGPMRDVPTAATVLQMGAQAGPGAASAGSPMSMAGFGASPFGDAADRPKPRLMESIPLTDLQDNSMAFRFGGPLGSPGFGSPLGRPLHVYGRRQYAGYGAADGLKWWEIVFAPFTWVSTAARGVYEARGGEEGAVERQKGAQERKTERVEERQGRKTLRVEERQGRKTTRVESAQGRKDDLAAARASRISSIAQAKATRMTAPPASSANAGSSLLDTLTDAASSYFPDDSQLTPDELAAVQQQQALDQQQVPAASPVSWPLVLFGGAAIAGIAYLASQKKRKSKKDK